MLITPQHLLVHHMFGNGFQDDLLYHFLKDQGESDWPLIPQIVLPDPHTSVRRSQTLVKSVLNICKWPFTPESGDPKLLRNLCSMFVNGASQTTETLFCRHKKQRSITLIISKMECHLVQKRPLKVT